MATAFVIAAMSAFIVAGQAEFERNWVAVILYMMAVRSVTLRFALFKSGLGVKLGLITITTEQAKVSCMGRGGVVYGAAGVLVLLRLSPLPMFKRMLLLGSS